MFEILADSPVAVTLISFIGALVALIGIYAAQSGLSRAATSARTPRA